MEAVGIMLYADKNLIFVDSSSLWSLYIAYTAVFHYLCNVKKLANRK